MERWRNQCKWYIPESGSQATATIECNVDPNAIAFAATGSVIDYSATFSFDITTSQLSRRWF